MAHRLIAGTSEKCAVPHGHNEYVKAYLTPLENTALNEANIIESFEAAKTRWHDWIDNHVDHAFQLSDQDPLIDFFKTQEPDRLPRLLITPGDPTTEILAACFKAKLNTFLADANSRLRCEAIEIEETPTNTVRFNGNPTQILPQGPYWFFRADMSINDI